MSDSDGRDAQVMHRRCMVERLESMRCMRLLAGGHCLTRTRSRGFVPGFRRMPAIGSSGVSSTHIGHDAP